MLRAVYARTNSGLLWVNGLKSARMICQAGSGLYLINQDRISPMSALDTFLIVLAVLALLGVIFEEVIHINKAKVTLFFGTMSWMLLFLFSDNAAETSAISAGLSESIAEIEGLWLFLVQP